MARMRSLLDDCLHDLEQAGRAHTAADAHRGDDVFDAPSLSFDERVTHHASARHSEGMTDGDRTAVDVEALHRDAELVAAVHRLARESFVELPEPDVVHLEAVSLQQARNREHRT